MTKNVHSARSAGRSPALTVAVGASAGGLDACKQLFAEMPADSGFAFVVVLHLDPSRESHLAEILGASSELTVVQVKGPRRLESDYIYVIAPNTSLQIEDGVLHPAPFEVAHGERRPIDVLFWSLARARGERSVAIVLSGIGGDGSRALEDVQRAGGLCIAQDPDTAQYPSMPRSAIDTGFVDAVLPPDQMAGYLAERAAHPRRPEARPLSREQAEAQPEGFAGILDLLAREHGLDPRAYKSGTLHRRAERRRASLMPSSGWKAYLEYLREHPGEVEALYRDVLIGVTQFFRDPEQWGDLDQEVIPRLLKERGDTDGSFRIWSVGCATGEEAYSLAILFLEHLERSSAAPRLQVFATDVSREALETARRGVYPDSIAGDVAPQRLARFFERDEDSYRVKQQVRDLVTFAPHDVLSDPPFPRIDFLSCRNLFIYLEPHAQERCLERFHFALRPRGLLWLGGAENVSPSSDVFTPVSSKHRLYRRSEMSRHRTASWTATAPSAGMPPPPSTQQRLPRTAAPAGGRVTHLVEQFILEHHASACAVVNQASNIVHLFGPTDQYLRQPQGEIRMDLLAWARSGLYAKLRAALKEALERGEKVTARDARVKREDTSVPVRITVEPIPAIAEDLFLVVFEDQHETPEAPPSAEAPEPGAGDETLVRDLTQQLQDTQAELQSSLEELDSANEEYRSSYEELLSLNEELQSSNEELETTKEEAQSINEELLSVNRELEERNDALRSVNADLENLLALTTIPIVFLDRELRIRRYTPAAEGVMWLVPSDVGRPIDHIKMRVDDERLRADAVKVMRDLRSVEQEVRGEAGRWYVRNMTPFVSDDRIEGVCVTYHDTTAQKAAREESEEARYYAEAIVRAARVPLVVLDPDLTVVSANAAFYSTFSVSREETLGAKLSELGNGQWDIPRLRDLLERVVFEKRAVQDFEVEHTFESIGHRQMMLNAALMERPGRRALILLSIEDVTQLREAQQAAHKRTRELEQEHRRKDEFLAMLGHELRNPLAALANGLYLLERRQSDPEAVENIRERLARQTHRMTAMLDQLLDVSRLVRGKIELAREPVDLADVAQAAVEAVTPAIESAGHDLEVSVPPEGSVLVRGDHVRLIQVVENLLSNSAKYTEDGGRIRLAVKAEDGFVRISVRDNGSGIDPALIPRIFDVFSQGEQQLDRSKGGLGLGLPLVRLLVTMHGGEVRAYSEGPGQGSEFVVLLPHLRGESARDAPAQEPAPAAPTAPPRRILVVDDEKDSADMLGDLLRGRGHEVRIAHDGPSALDVAETFAPEVVLLDLGLPGMDGYEVATKLRAGTRQPRPLIVALTGYQRDPESLRDAGFDDHLLKPPDIDRLAELLRGA